jgi:transcriptional regulator GlxA family with amidase domain
MSRSRPAGRDISGYGRFAEDRPTDPFARFRRALFANVASAKPAIGITLLPTSAQYLEAFIGSMLVERHPHNYSDALSGPWQAAASRIVKEAEQLMRSEQPQSISLVAKRSAVSLRTLELGFREYRRSTPAQFLRRRRLDAARELGFREYRRSTPAQFLRRRRLDAARTQLLAVDATTTVTSVALANGFPPGALCRLLSRAFDEYPSETLNRSRRRGRAW